MPQTLVKLAGCAVSKNPDETLVQPLITALLKDEDVYLVTFVQFSVVACVGALLAALFAPPFHPFGFISAGALLFYLFCSSSPYDSMN